MVTPTSEGGRGMTAQWDDDVHHALHVALTGERHGYYADFAGGDGRDEAGPLAVLAKVLTRGFLHDGTLSTFRGRPWGRPVDTAGLDARRLLGYLQTHDQVGNRMAGDRVSATLAPGLQAAGAALYLLAPTTPMVFMGEEWAASTPWQFFTSFEEDALADAVREGRRTEFGSHGWSADAIPDPQDPATRDRSVLRWGERDEEPHAAVLRWYTACTALRRELLGTGPTRLADVDVPSTRRPAGSSWSTPPPAARHPPSSSTSGTSSGRCRWRASARPACCSRGTPPARPSSTARCGCRPGRSPSSASAERALARGPGTRPVTIRAHPGARAPRAAHRSLRVGRSVEQGRGRAAWASGPCCADGC